MPRTQESNKQIKEERRSKILSGALFLFATRGLTATKISDIAKYTEMSQGLIYHYFKNKEDIFITLVATAFERLLEACNTLALMECSAKEKIEMAVSGLLDSLQNNQDASSYHLLIAQASANEAIPEKAKDIIKKNNKIPYQIMAQIMAGGQQEGSVKQNDPNHQATLFWTTINGLAIYRSSHGPDAALPPASYISAFFLKD